MKKTDFSLVRKGILDDNPVYSHALALCPVLAVTVTAINGLGMGLATLAVMLASCLLVSLLRKVIPSQVRIPILILICASFATVVRFALQAYFPALDDALGIFIALIAVNCIIMARMESFAMKNSPLNTTFDAIGMGLGFTLALFLIGFVRELLGSGTILGGLITLPEAFPRTAVMTLPPGGFFVLGFLIFGFVKFRNRFLSGDSKKPPVKPKGGCASKACTMDCGEGGAPCNS
ncbi:MAG: electron transport complex subunit RsxE [Defluviitaleaceae bacterium]|nr:electron transport complex subunit RsxE [Defluviitaleaceae bacterium]